MEEHNRQLLREATKAEPAKADVYRTIYKKDTRDTIVEAVQSINSMFDLGDSNMMSQTQKLKRLVSTLRDSDAIAMGLDLKKRTVRDRLRAKLGSR